MITDDQQKWIKRIVDLLALADPGSGATAEEAKAAMKKAQELRTKFAIAEEAIFQAQVSRAEGALPRSYNIKHERYTTGRKYKYMYDAHVSAIIQKCFGVKNIWTTTNGYITYMLVGDEIDLKIALTVLPILLEQVNDAINGYFKSINQRWVIAVARAFADGLVVGYCEGSEEGKNAARKSALRKDADAYSIVLVDKDNAMCAYMEKNWKLTYPKRRGHGEADDNGHATNAGLVHGRTMSVMPKLTN